MSYSALIFLVVCAASIWGLIVWRMGVWAFKDDGQDTPYPMIAFALHLAVGWMLWVWLLINVPVGFVGVDKNYGHGDVSGYLYIVERSGAVWKTYEVSILVGETEADSLHYRLSTPSKNLGETLMRLRGKRVKIEYRQWYSAPWKVGATDIEITHVEANEPEVEQEE